MAHKNNEKMHNDMDGDSDHCEQCGCDMSVNKANHGICTKCRLGMKESKTSTKAKKGK